jgi:EAL domain-containing protein (putative c-di-GMP-specific phosphodiesterase class I)
MSVNLSSKQVAQPDLVNQIRDILDETNVEAKYLKLEITESAVMDNAEMAARLLKRLKALGVQLSIDDFGTGYSSLGYLHRFPVNTLKIDRSFVGRIGEAAENIEIVRAIVSLAENMGMDVCRRRRRDAEPTKPTSQIKLPVRAGLPVLASGRCGSSRAFARKETALAGRLVPGLDE